jgi:ribosomal protein L37E
MGSSTSTRRAVDMYNTRHSKITNCGFPSYIIHIQLGKHQISIYGSFFLYGLIDSPTPTRRAVDMYNTRHPKITNCGFPPCSIHIQVREHKKAIYEASHKDFQVSNLLTFLGGSEVIICAS